MQEHAKRIERIQALCANVDEAIRASKNLLATAAELDRGTADREPDGDVIRAESRTRRRLTNP